MKVRSSEQRSSSSIFNQIVALIPRNVLEKVTGTFRADKYRKKHTIIDQFITMLFSQLSDCNSLREIEAGLAASGNRLIQGDFHPIPRSTLSYLNKHTDPKIFEAIYYALFHYFKPELRAFSPNKIGKILSLDSSVISLTLNIYDWARYRRQKGGIKIHTLLDNDSACPEFVTISNASHSDVSICKEFIDRIASGSLITMDRGYFDSELFKMLDDRHITFVTRLKKGILNEHVGDFHYGDNYIDTGICLRGKKAQKLLSNKAFRLVEWKGEENRDGDRVYEFITNAGPEYSAEDIAEIYKKRWQVELFFKHIKQNCKIKSFVGTSCNAVLTQIWTALISALLMTVLHRRSQQLKSGNHCSKSKFFYLVRLRLLMYIELNWMLTNIEAPQQVWDEVERRQQLKLNLR